jgi:hypothetical protein
MLAVRQVTPGLGGGVCENARRESEANCRRHITITMPVVVSAMYGRRPRCKGKIGHFSEAFGCSHVFGL